MKLIGKLKRNACIALCLVICITINNGKYQSVRGDSETVADNSFVVSDSDTLKSDMKEIVLPQILKDRAVTFNNLKKKNTVYLDQALGFKGNDALGAIRKYFNKNWNSGIHYNGAKYISLNSANVGININYNFQTKTQYKCRQNPGYGYNCTGVCTSVLYYASKTKKSWGAYYKDLCNGQGIGKMCNGFYWWAYINKYNVKRFCAGRVSNADDVNKILKNNKNLQVGYMVYFAPTVRGQDCHLGFYWGQDSKGNQMMRHSIWRGFEWSRAFPGARGTYDMYLIPFSHGKTGTKTYTYNLKIQKKLKTKKVKVNTGDTQQTTENVTEKATEGTTKNNSETESVTKESETETESETESESESESEGETENESEDESELEGESESNLESENEETVEDNATVETEVSVVSEPKVPATFEDSISCEKIYGGSEINNTAIDYKAAAYKKVKLSLKGDTYDFYAKRKGSKLYQRLKCKTKYKNNILPLSLNKKGRTIRNVKIKVKATYENGKLINYYISSIGKCKLKSSRKNNKSFWIRECKSSTPKGYKYRKQIYAIRAEKTGKNVKLCLYKGSMKKKNYVRSVKKNKTLIVKIKN